MGTLMYAKFSIDFEDRVLAHLKVVIVSKLRRGEALQFSWRESGETGHGRTTIWLHPSIPVTFTFYGSRAPTLNQDWLVVLMASANSNQGLQLTPEPPSSAPPAPSRRSRPS
jgi:hypothetical protein